MPSKTLMGIYGFLEFALLVAGAILIAFSQIFGSSPDIMLHLTFTPSQLLAGLILGIAFVLTFIVSVGAVVQKNHVTVGFVVLNWFLILDAILVIVVGTILWFVSLQQRANFFTAYQALAAKDTSKIIAIQDRFKCCGYFSQNDTLIIGGATCSSQAVVDANFTTAANVTANSVEADVGHCVGPITKFTDFTLNNTFTTIYGFMAIIIALFLASLCVIKKRQESERFKRIDAKRGGRGFV